MGLILYITFLYIFTNLYMMSAKTSNKIKSKITQDLVLHCGIYGIRVILKKILSKLSEKSRLF